jgi:hypothetical protein
MKIKISIDFDDIDQEDAKRVIEMLEQIHKPSELQVTSVQLVKVGDPQEGMIYPNMPGVCTRYSDMNTNEIFQYWKGKDNDLISVKGKDRSGQWRNKDIILTTDGWEVSPIGRMSGRRGKFPPDECQRIATALGATFDGKRIKGKGILTPEKAVEIWKYFIR